MINFYIYCETKIDLSAVKLVVENSGVQFSIHSGLIIIAKANPGNQLSKMLDEIEEDIHFSYHVM